ncbi:molybdopterin cofactor-binding domain-containing protein [Dokdonella soli]
MNLSDLVQRAGTPSPPNPPLEGEGFESSAHHKASRRAFLKSAGSISAGLVVACFIPTAMRKALAEAAPAAKPPVSPNAFIHIAPDNSVTVLLKHSEMGQGVWTSIPMVVAEELGCDWKTIKVEHAPAAPEYAHTAFGIQMTGGAIR